VVPGRILKEGENLMGNRIAKAVSIASTMVVLLGLVIAGVACGPGAKFDADAIADIKAGLARLDAPLADLVAGVTAIHDASEVIANASDEDLPDTDLKEEAEKVRVQSRELADITDSILDEVENLKLHQDDPATNEDAILAAIANIKGYLEDLDAEWEKALLDDETLHDLGHNILFGAPDDYKTHAENIHDACHEVDNAIERLEVYVEDLEALMDVE